jgi:hypothetical protein
MIRFNLTYFALAVLLFVIEVLIGFYLNDAVIRPYGGDVLVVILIYCTVQSFLNLPPLATALSVLALAFAIEILQYFNLVTMLGLEHYRPARIILGTSFSFADLLCYTLGIATVLLVEKVFNHEPTFKN